MRFVPSRSRTRWLLVTGTAAAACVVAVVTGTVAANADAKAPQPQDLLASPGRVPAAPPETPKAVGAPIATGIPAKDGEWVLFGAAVDDAVLPGTDFGIMLGRRLADGNLASGVMTNEVEGSDTAPGFHAVSGSMSLDEGDTPTFGYYVGPAATITGTVDGKKVTAKQAAWSEDPSVVVFWFGPKTSVQDLAAFDAAGKKLPTGNSGVTVG